ncbi:MAG TPA: major capsid protein [bacterium]|nr:major capsid protein [bacterium]
MPQMTPAQARVIDPILTEVARGYQNAAYIGNALFPVVPVGLRGGKILQFGKEHFRLYNTARAPGSDVAVIQFGYAGQSYALADHAIAGLVPVEDLEEASQQPGIDLGSDAVRSVQDIIAIKLEVEQATLARNAALYAASNKATLSGASQWSDPSSDPIKAIEDAKEAIRGQVVMRPNTLVLGPKVFAALKQHPKIIDRIKYTGRDVPTAELLASLFGVQRVVSGDAVYQDADGVMVDVWGKDAILAYTNLSGIASRRVPSYGYTYRLRNFPVVETPWYNPAKLSWMYPVRDAMSAVLAGAEAGFLFQNAVA